MNELIVVLRWAVGIGVAWAIVWLADSAARRSKEETH